MTFGQAKVRATVLAVTSVAALACGANAQDAPAAVVPQAAWEISSAALPTNLSPSDHAISTQEILVWAQRAASPSNSKGT